MLALTISITNGGFPLQRLIPSFGEILGLKRIAQIRWMIKLARSWVARHRRIKSTFRILIQFLGFQFLFQQSRVNFVNLLIEIQVLGLGHRWILLMVVWFPLLIYLLVWLSVLVVLKWFIVIGFIDQYTPVQLFLEYFVLLIAILNWKRWTRQILDSLDDVD